MEKKELTFVLIITLMLFFCLIDYAPISGFFVSGSVIKEKIIAKEIEKESYDFEETTERKATDIEKSKDNKINIFYSSNVEKNLPEKVNVLVYNPKKELKIISTIESGKEKEISLKETIGVWSVYLTKDLDVVETVDSDVNKKIFFDNEGNSYYESFGEIYRIDKFGLTFIEGKGTIIDGTVVFFKEDLELIENKYIVIEGDETNKIDIKQQEFEILKEEKNPEIIKLALDLKNKESVLVEKIMWPFDLKSKLDISSEKIKTEDLFVKKIQVGEKHRKLEISEGNDQDILDIYIVDGIPSLDFVF
jgi:hypothetical protein